MRHAFIIIKLKGHVGKVYCIKVVSLSLDFFQLILS